MYPLSPESCQKCNLVVWECWKLIDKSRAEEILGEREKKKRRKKERNLLTIRLA